MKTIGSTTVILLYAFTLLQSCTHDKEILAAACPESPEISFASTIKLLLHANCFSCHGNGASFGNVSLESYEKDISDGGGKDLANNKQQNK